VSRLAAILARPARVPRSGATYTRRRVAARIDGATVAILTLCAFVASSAVMAWAGWWHPWVGVVFTAVVAVVGLAFLVRRPMHWSLPEPRRTLVDVAVLAIALAAWLVALSLTDIAKVGQFGLLGVVNPLFFAAPVLCVGGFIVEVFRGARRPLVLGAYLMATIAILHASTPLLLNEPQYAWTYKHIGVIDLIQTQGHLGDPSDIYQQWPAFFTAAAQLCQFLGVSAVGIAPWAPVFFNVLSSVLLFAIARTLSPDRRVAWATVLLFQCLNWIEEDYLAPQGLAFVLSLAVLYLVLRYLRPGTGGYSWWQRGLAIAAVAVTMAVLSASHQLSPFLVAAIVVAFAIFRVIRPWWVCLIVLAIPVLYLVPRFSFVSGSFGIFSGFDILKNAGGNGGMWGSTGQALSAIAVRLLSISVWALAAWSAWRSRHAFRRVLAPVIAALIPFSLVLAQSYGGEAIYRVFLFSAPWCAFLIVDWVLWAQSASALAQRSAAARERDSNTKWKARVRVREVASIVVASLMLFATIQGRHGQLEVDRQTASEVAAAQYLYANGQPGSTVMLAAPIFPSRIAANYSDFNRSVTVGEPDLVIGANLRGFTLNQQYLPAIENYAESFHGTTTYLVVSNGMRRYADYFGALPSGSLDSLEQTLQASPQWTTFFHNDDVTIYQLTQPPQ
jgi:hypothetical protein